MGFPGVTDPTYNWIRGPPARYLWETWNLHSNQSLLDQLRTFPAPPVLLVVLGKDPSGRAHIGVAQSF